MLLITLALFVVAANAPFVFQRAFLFFPMPKTWQPKSTALCLLEWLLLYFLAGGFAWLLEVRAHASRYPQGWEFYVVTFCLFLVVAFPGFVWRYLWRAPRKDASS